MRVSSQEKDVFAYQGLQIYLKYNDMIDGSYKDTNKL